MSRSRAYCFTLNNPTEDEFRDLLDIKCRYIIAASEVGESDTPHVQGFIYFAEAVSFSSVKRLIGGRSHIERARGTTAQAIAYCQKDGDYVEFGIPPLDARAKGIASAAKWAAIRKACENRDYGNLPDDFICRNYRSYNGIRQLYLEQRKLVDLDVLENYWYHGDTGTGKSRAARAWCHARGLAFYLKDLTTWWCGYEHEPVVIIDEFGPDAAKLLGEQLKIWTDHYVCRVQPKFGSMLIRPKHFIICSNWTLQTLFSTHATSSPLERRFTTVTF